MKKLISGLAAVIGLASAGQAYAAGFQLDVLDGRATGQVAAVTANIDDASGIFYNPAGIARGKSIDVRAGATPIIPTFSYHAVGTGASTDTKFEIVPPPHVYAAFGLTDELTLGIGEFSQYGLAVPWPDDWKGASLVQLADLRTYNFNPTIAFKLGSRLRVGIGVQIVRGTVELKQAVNFVDSQGQADLAGSGWGAGGNFGLQLDVIPNQLTFGAAYRSAVDLPIDNGKVHFSNIPPEFSGQLKDQGGRTDFLLPHTVQLGLGYKPMENLSVEFDAVYTGWQSNDAVAIQFDDPSLNRNELKNWHHTWNYHLGGEYTLNPQLRIRGGLEYDPTPSPAETVAPDLPDSSRVNIGLGAGYKVNEFSFDLGYQLVIITSTTSTNPALLGDYHGIAHVIALTVGYHI